MTQSELLISLAEILEDLIASRTGIVEASRYIASSRFALKQDSNPLFLPFVGIDSNTDKFPLGKARDHWATDALARCDQERKLVEQQYARLASTSAVVLLKWVRTQSQTR